MNQYKVINANFDAITYPIFIGNNIYDKVKKHIESKTNNKKIMLVCDIYFKHSIGNEIVKSLENDSYEVFTYYMKAGKGNKNISEALKIFGIMEENNLARDSVLIAIGGGVIGDLSGFAASTWLRGMKLLHIPTTLMSMVDSSIGGKVAINFRNTINAIGNYYHPFSNFIDLNTLKSLSTRDYISGLAEVIKCAIINDTIFFNYLIDNRIKILNKENTFMIEFITKTIIIKINHVNGDLKEDGKRLLLNYGHTLGHAVEMSTEVNHEEQLRHGEGVSLGIVAAAYIEDKYLKNNNNLLNKYEKILSDYGLPIYISASKLGFSKDILLNKCYANIKKDKKRLNNNIRLILSDSIGSAKVYEDVPFKLIEEAFKYIIKD